MTSRNQIGTAVVRANLLPSIQQGKPIPVVTQSPPRSVYPCEAALARDSLRWVPRVFSY